MTTPYVPIRQYFTFTYSSPSSCMENGDEIDEQVSISFNGEDLEMSGVLEKFKDFLSAVGYSSKKIYIEEDVDTKSSFLD